MSTAQTSAPQGATHPQQAKGIAGTHQQPQAGATSARNTTKSKVRKYGMILGGILLIIMLLFIWKSLPKGWLTGKSEETATTSAKGMTSGPVSTQQDAKWSDVAKDGTLPVGVWSEWIPLDLDCKFRFQLDEKVIAEWRDAFGKEHELRQGSKIDGVKAVRFQPRVPGLKEYPMKKICN